MAIYPQENIRYKGQRKQNKDEAMEMNGKYKILDIIAALPEIYQL